MELIVFAAVMFGIFLYVMFRGAYEEKRRKARYRESLREAYGSFSDREYRPEDWERIARYYLLYGEQQENGNVIDDITWNDLNMDGIFALMDFTQSSSGEEYLYALLHRSRLSDEDGAQASMERHIGYMAAQEQERLDTMMLLHALGRTAGKYSLCDYLRYLETLGSRSNGKHYAAIAALAGATGLIFVKAPLGVALLIAVACFNMITYMKEKSAASPYVTTFAYIMRMINCADGIVRRGYGAEMEDYLGDLRRRRDCFSAFEKHSGMVMKMNAATGNVDDLLFDYVKMLTHIDIIKFNRMLQLVRENRREIEALVAAIGYLDTVISIAYFRAALPWWCAPMLTEGRGVPLVVEEGYHPALGRPVPNSFSQTRGMLVTGSNASGKSTFLKMTAINAILAQTIHTCAAQAYSGNYYRIYSSMALRDSLEDGESYYIVEIKALKRIMDAAAEQSDNPLLCFVDEVLRGTNTVERIAASAQIMEKLSQQGIYCFAATHDIELTHLLEASYDNYHFEEEVKEGDVLFSYRLLAGRAHTRNAIKLLEIIGFSQDIIRRADDMAGEFLRTGEWSRAGDLREKP
ncbi:MAG: hypothetical protein NC337_12255 [Roseburia sp.]|nr:hypothetical protein [Roseburia sp.]